MRKITLLILLAMPLFTGCQSLDRLMGWERPETPAYVPDNPPADPAPTGFNLVSEQGSIGQVPVVWLPQANDGAYIKLWARAMDPVGPVYGPWQQIPACTQAKLDNDETCHFHEVLPQSGHYTRILNINWNYQVYHIWLYNPA